MTGFRAIVAVRLVATLATAAMVGVIAWASATGSFGDEGAAILGLAWGVVSLVDLYTGALVVWLWIAWRDGPVAAVAWLVAMVLLGNLASAGYVAWRAWTSSDVRHLLLGRHAATAGGRE